MIKYCPEIEYSEREIQEVNNLKIVLLSLDYNGIKIDKNRLVESMEKIEIYQLLINYLQKELDINKNDNGKIYQKKK